MRVGSSLLALALIGCNPPINEPPELHIIEIEQRYNGKLFPLGRPVPVGLQIKDGDGDPIHVVITSNQPSDPTVLSELDLQPGPDVEAIEISAVVGGLQRIKVTATDGWDTVEQSFDLQVNTPPAAPAYHIDPEAPISSEAMTARLEGAPQQDADGHNLYYELVFKTLACSDPVVGNGFVSASGSNAVTVPATSLLRGATWNLCVTTFEADGFLTPYKDDPARPPTIVTDQVVIGNAPPVVTSAWIEPLIAHPANDLLCAFEALDDADGDTVTFAYRWSNNGADTGHTAGFVPAIDIAAGDSWACEVTPHDGLEAGETVGSPARSVGSGIVGAATLLRTIERSASQNRSGAYDRFAAGTELIGGGQAELVVGAPSVDAGGVVEIYESHKLTTSSKQPKARIKGEPGMLLGTRIVRMPDINGDGHPELLIGAPGALDVVGPSVMLVVSGSLGATASEIPFPWSSSELGVYLLRHQGGAQGFGANFAGGGLAGGVPWVGVTERRDDTGSSVWLFPSAVIKTATGAPRVRDTTTGVQEIGSSSAGDDFGASLDLGGDVDGSGDGFVIISAPGGASASAWIWESAVASQGGLAGIAGAYTSFRATASGHEAGAQVRFVPDVNGDGYDEVLITAPGDGAGAAHLFYGGALESNDPIGLDSADVELRGASAGARFGDEVQIIGDIGHDTAPEIAISAPFQASPDAKAGAGVVYVFSGGLLENPGTYTAADAALAIAGQQAGDNLTLATGGAGDMTGDGVPDLLLAAPGWDTAGFPDDGRIYVFPTVWE